MKTLVQSKIKSVCSAFAFLSSILITCNAAAFDLPVRLFGTIAGGAAFTSNLGFSQNFPIQNPVTDEFYNYKSNNQTQITTFFDGLVGGEWYFGQNWFLQTGFEYNQITGINGNGSVTQGADVPSQDTFGYSFNVKSRQALLTAKLLGLVGGNYYPYFSLSAGEAFNDAYGYQTTIPPYLTFTRMYQSKNTKSFSYAVGIGMEVSFDTNFRFGVGYRFLDAGKVNFGNATIDTTTVSGTLSQTNLYFNQIIAQLTYVVC